MIGLAVFPSSRAIRVQRSALTGAFLVVMLSTACASRTPATVGAAYEDETLVHLPGAGSASDPWASYRGAGSPESVRDDVPESFRREWVAKQDHRRDRAFGRPVGLTNDASGSVRAVREVIREVPVRERRIDGDRGCDDRRWALPLAVGLGAYGYHRRRGSHAYWYGLGSGALFPWW